MFGKKKPIKAANIDSERPYLMAYRRKFGNYNMDNVHRMFSPYIIPRGITKSQMEYLVLLASSIVKTGVHTTGMQLPIEWQTGRMTNKLFAEGLTSLLFETIERTASYIVDKKKACLPRWVK